MQLKTGVAEFFTIRRDCLRLYKATRALSPRYYGDYLGIHTLGLGSTAIHLVVSHGYAAAARRRNVTAAQ